MGLRKEQAGFHHNRSCIDQINTLRVIIEQSVEFRSHLYMLFVDYQRVFDSLSRAWIWYEIKVRGLPSKFINIIKEGYEDVSCRVLHEGQLSDSINPYLTAFPYGNGMVLHFYQQQESSTTKTVHKVINKRLKTYV